MTVGTAFAIADELRAVRDLCIASVCSTHRLRESDSAALRRTYPSCEDWAVHALLPGGKWLRSQLALGVYDGLTPTSPTERDDLAVALGAALELFHTFALVHDDIMDRAVTRRGKPTVHVAARRTHLEQRGPGDADDFGRSAAILTGDLLFSRAWGLVCRVATSVPQVLELWSAMCEDVVAGQMLEINATALPAAVLDPAGAFEVIDLKTGLYTFSYPMRMAALLAGHLPGSAVSQELMRAGIDIGRGFQLQDDLLDVYGDAAATGKPTGVDIDLGKPTVFRALCVQRLVAEGRAVDDALRDFDSSRARAAEIGVATGVHEELRRQIQTCFDAGLRRMAALPWSSDGQQLFTRLIDSLRERNR